MIFVYGDYSSHPEGFLFNQNLKRKGITRPVLQPLNKREVIEQTEEPRGVDWHDLSPTARAIAGLAPIRNQKILIPYTGRRARIEIQVIDKNPAVNACDLSLYVEDRQVRSWIRVGPSGSFDLVADIPLHEADYTVLTLNAPTFQLQRHQTKRGSAQTRACRGSDSSRTATALVGAVAATPLAFLSPLVVRIEVRTHTRGGAFTAPAWGVLNSF